MENMNESGLALCYCGFDAMQKVFNKALSKHIPRRRARPAIRRVSRVEGP